MTIFSSPGYVVRLPAPGGWLGVYLGDIYGSMGCFNFNDRLAAVTAFNTEESASVQLRMMFENKSYINVFGDNFGFMSLSGMFAGVACDGYQQGHGGFEGISSYFREHRASRLAPAINILLGGIFRPMYYAAFLLNCKISTADPQLQMGNFSLSLAYPMPDTIDDPLNRSYQYSNYIPGYGYSSDFSGRQAPTNNLL